jgi:hypothetical protein
VHSEDFYMATSGDIHLSTREDFLMPTDGASMRVTEQHDEGVGEVAVIGKSAGEASHVVVADEDHGHEGVTLWPHSSSGLCQTAP